MNNTPSNYIVRPALCLDFDGTIRYSLNGRFINKPEDIALFPGVEKMIWEYRDKGYLIFGITNQAGVAFGYRTAESVKADIQRTVDLFEKDPFDTIQYSFLHPKGTIEPYKYRTLLRKPDIGMLVLCEKEMFEKGIIVDWDNSIFVGDRPEDEECAQKAGIQFIHADTFFNRGKQEEE
jgi:D-glycero-D-manno-heptose 1,7-bisphosphate phosphatase